MSTTNRALLASSALFDVPFYLEQYPDVAAAEVDPIEHYLQSGWREHRRPHPTFDGFWYLHHNPDVAQADVNPLVHYLSAGRSEGRRGHKRSVVYTAIIGNYDDLRAPLIVDPEVDYVAFVDDWIVDAPKPWIRRRFAEPVGNDRLTARFIKTHPHVLLPEYELSVWADAAFQIRTVRGDSMHASLGERPIALFAHPDRNCVYDEAAVVLEHQLDAPESVERIVKTLLTRSHPPKAGLSATGFMVRRHNDPRLVRAMERWWELISTESGRDQLSIDLVLREEETGCARLPGTIWHNEFVEWIGHRPKPWKGLQCGGAYLDAEEYEAIEQVVHEFGIRSAIETGAGETSILFDMLGVQTLSIECTPGPWSRRATLHGCRVVDVSFDVGKGSFSPSELQTALQYVPNADLLLIDSPIGTGNRRMVLSQMLGFVRIRYVAYHDVRRDLGNIFGDQEQFDLRLLRFVDSPRGLALFAVEALPGR